ncbi:integumentary mucin C.1-like [Salvia splendens]|uniref:integumentary mucin C.1-like n=1 Tax=Salvia splendens TaxID=180675 RepID=UPI001C264BDC|nr:integumentary mucin C.1-like [Salvia splendens]
MATQQVIVVALMFFFAAVAIAEEPSIPAAAVDIAPATAAAGLDPNSVIGALSGAAADAAPIGGPVPQGVFKSLPPSAAGGSPTAGAAAVGTNAAAAVVVAAGAGIVGSFYFL